MKFASTNQNHFPDLGSDASSEGISALVSHTSFRGETVGAVSKCRLFSHANSFREKGFSPFIVIVFIAAGIYSQTRSSVPPKNPLINLLFEG